MVSVSTLAQSLSDAETLFDNKQYEKAQRIFETHLKRRPNDFLLNYRVARCAFEQEKYFESIPYFKKAGTRFPLTNYYLAEACFLSYQFDKAAKYALLFLEKPSGDNKLIKRCEYIVKKSHIGSKLINRIENLVVIDSLLVNESNFLNAYKFSKDLGTLSQSRIKLNSKNTQDKITFTTQRNDRRCFSDSVNGHIDLFSSDKLLEKWSKPVSFSETLNTKANENYPFMMPDGITIFYASDGEGSIGGYDLFMSKYAPASKDYLTPENIGFPFNSMANDYMMVLDENQQKGWFSTDRNQLPGKVMIYTFELEDEKKFVRTTDSVAMYNAATLKTYRLAQNRKLSSQVPSPSKPQTKLNAAKALTANQIIINDSTVYSTIDEFTDENARNHYMQFETYEAMIKKIQEELIHARKSFDSLLANERDTLRIQIPILERKLIALQQSAELNLQMAVNSENKNIAGRQ